MSLERENHDPTCCHLAVSFSRRYTICTAPERACGKRSHTQVKQAFHGRMAFDALAHELTIQVGGQVRLLLTTSSSSLQPKRADNYSGFRMSVQVKSTTGI